MDFYIHGSVLRESLSVTVEQDATIYRFLLFFLQTALHVSDDTLIHHQEHIQTLITSGTGRIFPTPPSQRTVANTVRLVPDAVITV